MVEDHLTLRQRNCIKTTKPRNHLRIQELEESPSLFVFPSSEILMTW